MGLAAKGGGNFGGAGVKGAQGAVGADVGAFCRQAAVGNRVWGFGGGGSSAFSTLTFIFGLAFFSACSTLIFGSTLTFCSSLTFLAASVSRTAAAAAAAAAFGGVSSV